MAERKVTVKIIALSPVSVRSCTVHGHKFNFQDDPNADLSQDQRTEWEQTKLIDLDNPIVYTVSINGQRETQCTLIIKRESNKTNWDERTEIIRSANGDHVFTGEFTAALGGGAEK